MSAAEPETVVVVVVREADGVVDRTRERQERRKAFEVFTMSSAVGFHAFIFSLSLFLPFPHFEKEGEKNAHATLFCNGTEKFFGYVARCRARAPMKIIK